MSLLVPWVVFPLVLAVLCLGCGLLVEALAGIELPAALLLPVGYSLFVVVGVLFTTNATTAQLTAPAVIALAVAGLGLGFRWRPRQLLSWPLAAAAAVFVAFGMPVLMTGRADFTGYIELDDTSTWLAFTDRLMTHGRSLAGLPPSTYQAALDWYWRQNGYPVGAYPPLGVGHVIVRTDSAWLIQPYVCFVAALLALGLYALLRGLIPSRPLRALIAFVAAQPALLYGYYLWGGSKEVAAAALLVLLAVLTPMAVRERTGIRSLLPLAVASAAMIEILNFGGAVWLVPVLLPAAVVGFRRQGRRFARPVAAFAGLAILLSLPPIISAANFVNVTSKFLTKESELGNLIHPLSTLQLFGIWPVGDFRLRPGHIGVTYGLIAILVAAAVAGIVWAWQSRAWELPLYVTGAVVGCAIAVAAGSPWIDAKALATASPALVVSGLAGAAWLSGRGRRIEAAVVVVAIAGGVLWSNALAYHDVWLAPRAQMLELQTIGKRFAGDGPTLMTEYQPYGVRHFLRSMDPEAVGELRTRSDFLRTGAYVAKGDYADLDQLDLNGILAYRTLVLLRTPAASRPPAGYDLVWSGRFYDVWRRTAQPPQILDHLPLGAGAQAAAVPSCPEVLQLARLASSRGGRLATVVRPPSTVVELAGTQLPSRWRTGGDPGVVYPYGPGKLVAVTSVPVGGRYGVYLGGSFRRKLEVRVDGRLVASARHQLNHPGAYTPLGTAELKPGVHAITLTYSNANLEPGSGGVPFALGPLILSRTTEELPITYVAPGNARSLCGKSLDWVEALAG